MQAMRLRKEELAAIRNSKSMRAQRSIEVREQLVEDAERKAGRESSLAVAYMLGLADVLARNGRDARAREIVTAALQLSAKVHEPGHIVRRQLEALAARLAA